MRIRLRKRSKDRMCTHKQNRETIGSMVTMSFAVSILKESARLNARTRLSNLITESPRFPSAKKV